MHEVAQFNLLRNGIGCPHMGLGPTLCPSPPTSCAQPTVRSADTFGAAASLKQLQKRFGLTSKNVVAAAKPQIAEAG
jgi:transketolase C-terminal domain/subunit